MDVVLNEYELRVLGSLIEKQIATPDYYPLTLNAVLNACNQKNHREPVVQYDEETVRRAIEAIKEKKLAYVFHGSESRVPKFGHLFPKAFDLNPAEVAVLCVLILRGPQTPGELRARTAHLCNFDQLSEVEKALQDLSARPRPLVAKLPRPSGSRESRYAQLLGGEVEIEEPSLPARPAPPSTPGRSDSERFTRLEEEIQILRRQYEELKQQFDNFRRQFD
ncbi:MAG TPA: DUF480 domain-containing protein [Blastocatellia bacterium]|nr:DUF480 domain-containing protein [Blastocatellia bacterium]